MTSIIRILLKVNAPELLLGNYNNIEVITDYF